LVLTIMCSLLSSQTHYLARYCEDESRLLYFQQVRCSNHLCCVGLHGSQGSETKFRSNAGTCLLSIGGGPQVSQEEKMEGLIAKSCKLLGLAGAVLALSLMAGCSPAPDPAQRAINAANRADQAASRAEAASQKAQQASASSQAAASRVEQAASDAKAAADRAEAIASKSMSSPRGGRRSYRRHRKTAAEAAPAPSDSGAAAPPASTP
jgi:hypothetical protein